ncbi:hypothetical protein L6164_022433 [Bauhinia variegata]|uniref:Uncharacterized protein n=1 Tax=Bauhinia variegata TaxID=167791 RepID=A0ACB9MF35_BAUVA|nr:hypothetical protein L6164_022433 [Bauhinia variegata]
MASTAVSMTMSILEKNCFEKNDIVENVLKDDQSGPLTTVTHPEELRPLPPRVPIPPTGFDVNDKVDAFDNGGCKNNTPHFTPQKNSSTMSPSQQKIDFHRDDAVEARVISRLGNGLYVVEYKNLLENDESGPLVETVHPKELRHLPPKITATTYALYDKVDAFDNDGWWVGKMTGRADPNYNVYFEYYNQEIAYPVSQLRFASVVSMV